MMSNIRIFCIVDHLIYLSPIIYRYSLQNWPAWIN